MRTELWPAHWLQPCRGQGWVRALAFGWLLALRDCLQFPLLHGTCPPCNPLLHVAPSAMALSAMGWAVSQHCSLLLRSQLLSQRASLGAMQTLLQPQNCCPVTLSYAVGWKQVTGPAHTWGERFNSVHHNDAFTISEKSQSDWGLILALCGKHLTCDYIMWRGCLLLN